MAEYRPESLLKWLKTAALAGFLAGGVAGAMFAAIPLVLLKEWERCHDRSSPGNRASR